jgi:PadR family transcriptional regulator PadR
MSSESWPSEWLKGILPLCVMAIVIENESHGYAIAQSLEERGIPSVKGGTLYPLLSRLETEGLVSTRWVQGPSGPGRKLYAPTPEGHFWFHANSQRWTSFTTTTVALLQHHDNEGNRWRTETKSILNDSLGG